MRSVRHMAVLLMLWMVSLRANEILGPGFDPGGFDWSVWVLPPVPGMGAPAAFPILMVEPPPAQPFPPPFDPRWLLPPTDSPAAFPVMAVESMPTDSVPESSPPLLMMAGAAFLACLCARRRRRRVGHLFFPGRERG